MQDVQAELAGAPVTFLGRLSGRELAAAYASAGGLSAVFRREASSALAGSWVNAIQSTADRLIYTLALATVPSPQTSL